PEPDVSDDIRMLFHPNTLKQLVYVRRRLLKKPLVQWSAEDLMFAGSLAGILHGAHRADGTSAYLSISMPNTFSMAPGYVRKYIAEKQLKQLDQDLFDCLRDKLARVYLDAIYGVSGRAFHLDATALLKGRRIKPESVDLLLT